MRFLITLVAVAAFFSPRAAAQEKVFVLDTATGQVSQKDQEQDTKIAALEKELAVLRGLVMYPDGRDSSDFRNRFKAEAPAKSACPCGDSCPCGLATAKKKDQSLDDLFSFRAAPVTKDALVVPKAMPASRAAVGHTHTCPKCGRTWDHAENPGHNCPNCGTAQYVQDSSPRAVPVAASGLEYQLAPASAGYSVGSGCANGSCSTGVSIQRRGLFGFRR